MFVLNYNICNKLLQRLSEDNLTLAALFTYLSNLLLSQDCVPHLHAVKTWNDSSLFELKRILSTIKDYLD